MANWELNHGNRRLVDSNSAKRAISVAVRRLEDETFEGVEFQEQTSTAIFCFGDFRLVVTPADYLENPQPRDEYWMLFMPEKLVLTAGPGGVDLVPSDK